jgi:uncharacterized protein
MNGMRSVGLLAGYLLAVFVGGALLAPWLYWGVGAAAGGWPLLHALSDHPFHRFVHRSLLLMGVAGLWPLLWAAGMRSWGDVGVRWGREVKRRFGAGFATVAVVMGGMALLTLGAGVREWRSDGLESAVNALMRAAMTGLTVGVLEELLFRGVLFGVLLKSLRPGVALIWSSVIYGAMHFLGRPAGPDELAWWSGLAVIGGMLSGLADWERLVPGMVALTLLGMVFGFCYRRTGDLMFSIGVHAGLVFHMKVFGHFTTGAAGANLWFWGSKRLMDGWFAVSVVCILWLVCDRVTRSHDWITRGRSRTPATWEGATTDSSDVG